MKSIAEILANIGPDPREREDRTGMYRLYDNLVGIDDGVDTPGERLGAGINSLATGLWNDPVGMVGGMGQAIDADLRNLMFEGGARDRPQDVLGYAAGVAAPGALVKAPKGALRAGLAGDSKAPATPAQEVAEMLRRGDASNVTDEIMALIDPQEMHRLYESGATGMPMPMDEASRMARAREMGFDEQAFHGTGSDFQSFNPDAGVGARSDTGTFTSNSPLTAETYAPYKGGTVSPLMRRGDSPIVSADMQDWNNIESPVYAYNPKTFDDIELIDEFGRASTNDIAGAGRGAVDSMSIQDVSDLGPYRHGMTDYPSHGTINVDYDPSNIRSRFARFDPRLKHLANLSAGIGGVAMLTPEEEAAEIRAYLEGIQ